MTLLYSGAAITWLWLLVSWAGSAVLFGITGHVLLQFTVWLLLSWLLARLRI